TSTTIALEPVGEESTLPQAALRRTFDKYFETALTKRTYTPYEWRTVGSFIRFGEKHRALELVRYLFRDQRPSGWNEWAEVVHEDLRKPAFIGDMPHTWVGSDFIRSALDLFVYERESENAIVIGAGVSAEWLDSGIRIAGLRTQYGLVSYSMKTEGDAVRITIDAATAVPPGGIVVVSPLDGSESIVRTAPASLSLPVHRSRQ
ncbi:MAG TPA: discoidin domain-containing protein, partial [Thermoanaerobaculia bacterium]|nr:discoidin domain-containing protein [Thermoanaerobaculia bacterium]